MSIDLEHSRTTESEALLDLMRQGAVETDSSRLVALICQYAARLVHADYAGVRMVAEQGQVTWAGMWGNRSGAWREPRISRRSGIAGEAIDSGRTSVWRLDPASPLSEQSVRTREGAVVEVASPLTYSGRVLGALVVAWRSDVSPSADQVRMVELLGGYGAAVLSGARSREESERRRFEAQALAELARQGAAAHETESVVELVCSSACRLIGAEYAAILIRTPGGVAWLGVWGNQSDIWYGRHDPSGRGPAARSMAQARTVVFTRDGESDGTLEGLQVLNAEDTQTALAVPLLNPERPIGSLVIGWRRAQRVSTRQRRLAEALGGYAAAVLDNALAHAESERRRGEAEALAELVRLGAAELDPERAIYLICERGWQLLDADYAGIAIVELDGRLIWHAYYGPDKPRRRWLTRGSGPGPTVRALAAGCAIVSEGVDRQLEPSQFHDPEGGKTGVAAPFTASNGLAGAFHGGWRQNVNVSPAQLRLAETVASYAAVILENARGHTALAERAETTRLANEQLTRIDEMKSNLISNVSHELRTPLASIRAFSELMLDPNMNAETRMEFSHIINQESERLTRLVANLLDLSRIQSHGVTWQFKPLDVRTELERAIAAMRPAADEKCLDIRLDVAPTVREARADADGLQQALVNLIANAIKFTRVGEIVVRAELEARGVRLSVTDTGSGMTEDEQTRVFDRFYQAGNILTGKPSGTGLGLAITKEILVQHGTDVSLDSSPGKGSCFSFVLPIGA